MKNEKPVSDSNYANFLLFLVKKRLPYLTDLEHKVLDQPINHIISIINRWIENEVLEFEEVEKAKAVLWDAAKSSHLIWQRFEISCAFQTALKICDAMRHLNPKCGYKFDPDATFRYASEAAWNAWRIEEISVSQDGT